MWQRETRCERRWASAQENFHRRPFPIWKLLIMDRDIRQFQLFKGAQIIKASHFDYEFFLGHKIVFICVAKGDPLPHISWFKDGIELYSHPYLQNLQISEWKVENDTIKSKLEIDPARQMDSGTYECQANNKYTVDRRAFKADFSTIT